MIAISSYKPFRRSEAIANNQLAAKATWDKVFSTILYFGSSEEKQLESDNTRFLRTCDYPKIKAMVAMASFSSEWVCIINADIQTNERLLEVEKQLTANKAQCAISLRWQLPEKRVTDQGLDWFAATPMFWGKIHKFVPDMFRIGHILWDTWMLAAFMYYSNGNCYDCTASRFIYHPKHSERVRPYETEIGKPVDGLINRMKWPDKRLDVTKQSALTT